MKPTVQTTLPRLPVKPRQPFTEAELPPAARELRRQLREWEASFQTRARRNAYIRRICQQIAAAYQPARIILFGSHAYGQPTPDSDVDLLIVLKDGPLPLPSPYQIRQTLKLYAPVDLHIRTAGEVEQRVREGDMFIREVVERGKVFYETQHA
ncbi:MAG: nucleotidyltransferase domain-containing protein [Acidobacteria bacterium]|nr:nucleotidyltransferase domain-containing protein [Acidobacteriota bacterium]MBI3422814.1 nucleotidyltransferase domain-containing protein [Acidobacteriota bacterium]